VVLFCIWRWQITVKHLVVLALLGTLFAELGLSGTQKIPFTCSYLPGKSNFHITFLLSTIAVLSLVAKAVQWESLAFEDARSYAVTVATLTILAILAWWRNVRCAKSPEGALQFEQTAEPAIFTLNLPRDSANPVKTAT
jgi:ABC-type Na+ efflux pump permease subunit